MTRTVAHGRGAGAVFTSCLVAACLGVGCSSSSPPRGGSPDAGGPAGVARIEVTPSSLVFTATGQSHPLTARAFDASGNEVPATIVWSSSKPSQVTVDPSGMVRTVTGIGSATIVAEAGAVHARPVPVAAVEPKAGNNAADRFAGREHRHLVRP